jgi:hypothetical protein
MDMQNLAGVTADDVAKAHMADLKTRGQCLVAEQIFEVTDHS